MICPFLFILLVSLFPRSPSCCVSLPILLPYFPLPFCFAFIYLLLCFYSLPFIFVWAKGPISIYPGSTIHCGILDIINIESTISMTPNILPIHFISCPFLLPWPTVTTSNNNGACQEWQQKCETLINVIRGMLRGRIQRFSIMMRMMKRNN